MHERILRSRPALYFGNSGAPFDSGVPIHNVFSGIVLAEGEITSPVAAVSLTLPPEFNRFQLSCVGFDFLTHSNALLADVVSQDDGATYICDEDNYDSYFTAVTAVVADVVGGTAVDYVTGYGDAISEITDGDWPLNDPYKASAEITIYPGGPNQLPNWTVFAAYRNKGDGDFVWKSSWHGLYYDATVPPVMSRATNFQLRDYVLGVNLLSAGKYTLVGMV